MQLNLSSLLGFEAGAGDSTASQPVVNGVGLSSSLSCDAPEHHAHVVPSCLARDYVGGVEDGYLVSSCLAGKTPVHHDRVVTSCLATEQPEHPVPVVSSCLDGDGDNDIKNSLTSLECNQSKQVMIGIFREFIQTVTSDNGPLGSFLRRFYVASTPAGVRLDPVLPEGTKGPFPCTAPHTLSLSSSSTGRRGRSRSAAVRIVLQMENIYAGCMTWLALGSPSHVHVAGARQFRAVRRTTMLALQIFVREWTYVCRGRVDLQFTGGRASLASQIRDGQPVSSPA